MMQLPPITPEILYKLGLAIEDGKTEDEQREMWGDATIDWINEASQMNQDAIREYWEADPLSDRGLFKRCDGE